MKDFLIVGRGLAATSLMHRFFEAGISFNVVGRADLSQCSNVAAGIWNPVVFKRLTKSWLADDLIPELRSFYTRCEKLLSGRIINERTILRPFHEQQEIELWKAKSKNELEDYLDPQIYEAEQAPLHTQIKGKFGKVLNCGYIDVPHFLKKSAEFFKAHIKEEIFLYENLQFDGDKWNYEGEFYSSVLFCEGWLVKDNPFFNWVPLKPAKGEVLHFTSSGLSLGVNVINEGLYILETHEGKYKAGATYKWDNLNDAPTKEGLEELKTKLQKAITKPFEITGQMAGVRPSAIDRRPVLGRHPHHKNLFIFNGLGTKGVMLCPYFSHNFVLFYLQNKEMLAEVDVSRFYHLYEKKT
jgi:hypothetical protein